MRWLMGAVIFMGVLIVAGIVVITVALVDRMSSPHAPTASAGVAAPPAAVVLDEPAGSQIVGTALAPDRLVLQIGGGGPDRVVILDTRTGRVLGRVTLARPP